MRADVLKRYNRDSLKPEQQQFLEKLVSCARLIQAFTQEKCWQQGLYAQRGLLASIIMAAIIDASDWGENPIAKKESNLLLLEKQAYWLGKSVESKGKLYRSYASWLDFATDYSDELTNAFEIGKHEKVLMAKNLDVQLELFSKLQKNPTKYCGKIESIIEKYGLWEFDC